ncbi:MAG: HAD family hydrolase [Desulfatiglandales bacterium]|jgi:HAD superfamily hydrolase (TIGR01509 family)|nr:HAD family hydrolase [Desulfatiglandales bacterium]
MERSPDVCWLEKRIDGIVFDVDGTLTDSIEAYYEVFREATSRFNIPIKREDVLGPMSTGSLIWERAIPKDIEGRDEKIKQVSNAISEIFPKVFEHVRPFPKVEAVLKALKKRSIKIGVVTSSWGYAIRPLHSYSLTHYLDVVISSEDGYPLKPAPDGILESLNRMEVDPSHALTIGDTLMDIRAGRSAGTLTMGVLSGIGSRAQLEAEGPTAVIENVAELLTLLNLM